MEIFRILIKNKILFKDLISIKKGILWKIYVLLIFCEVALLLIINNNQNYNKKIWKTKFKKIKMTIKLKVIIIF